MPNLGMPALRRLTRAVLIAAFACGAQAQDRPFQFGLVGDMPYSKAEEPEFDRVIAQINGKDLAFVVHIGDMQNDPRPHNQNPAGSAVPMVVNPLKAEDLIGGKLQIRVTVCDKGGFPVKVAELEF